MTPCGHYFHTVCLEHALTAMPDRPCPLCRVILPLIMPFSAHGIHQRKTMNHLENSTFAVSMHSMNHFSILQDAVFIGGLIRDLHAEKGAKREEGSLSDLPQLCFQRPHNTSYCQEACCKSGHRSHSPNCRCTSYSSSKSYGSSHRSNYILPS